MLYKTVNGKKLLMAPDEESEVTAFWAANDANGLSDTENRKRTEINAACESALFGLKKGYPVSEVDTWDLQETEARAYLSDPQATVPFISGIAAARGILISNLAARIVAKADIYTAALIAAIGKRQQLHDQIDAILNDVVKTDAEKITAINAIVW